MRVLFHCTAEREFFFGEKGRHRETVLHWFRLRYSAQIERGNRQGEDLRSPRWKHHHCRAERFRFAEVLLQPKITGKGASGIRGISFQMKCDGDIRKELYANVVLSVTRTFSKDVEHMTNELTDSAPSTMTSGCSIREVVLSMD